MRFNRIIHLILVCCLSGMGALKAQNLVPNMSFENLGTPPCSWITSGAGFTAAVNNWTMPSDGSTDIFSNYVATTCYGHNMSTNASRMGQQQPRSGNAQSMILTYGAGCGFVPNYREYLQVQLTSPMVIGQSYDIEFYVSLGDESQLATNNLGAHFRVGSYYQATCFTLALTPQFNYTGVVNNKTGWVLISGSVVATAAWTHMILGNFFSNAATVNINTGSGASTNTRYYVDDVTVRQTTILAAPNLTLRAERSRDGGVGLSWAGDSPSEIASCTVQRTTDGLSWIDVYQNETQDPRGERQWVDKTAPAGQLVYRLRYTDKAGNQFQTESVTVSDELRLPYRLEIADHPVPAGAAVKLRIAFADNTPATLEVYDLRGALVWKLEELSLIGLSRYEIPEGTLPPDIYILRVRTPRGDLVQKLVIGGSR